MLAFLALFALLCLASSQLVHIEVDAYLSSPKTHKNAPSLGQDASPFMTIETSGHILSTKKSEIRFTTREGFEPKNAYMFMIQVKGPADKDRRLRNFMPMGLILNMTVLPALDYVVIITLPIFVKPGFYQLLYGDDLSFEAIPIVVGEPKPFTKAQIKAKLEQVELINASTLCAICLSSQDAFERCVTAMTAKNLASLDSICKIAGLEEEAYRSVWLTHGFPRKQHRPIYAREPLFNIDGSRGSGNTLGQASAKYMDDNFSVEGSDNELYYAENDKQVNLFLEISEEAQEDNALGVWVDQKWIKLYKDDLNGLRSRCEHFLKKRMSLMSNWRKDIYFDRGLPVEKFATFTTARQRRSRALT